MYSWYSDIAIGLPLEVHCLTWASPKALHRCLRLASSDLPRFSSDICATPTEASREEAQYSKHHRIQARRKGKRNKTFMLLLQLSMGLFIFQWTLHHIHL